MDEFEHERQRLHDAQMRDFRDAVRWRAIERAEWITYPMRPAGQLRGHADFGVHVRVHGHGQTTCYGKTIAEAADSAAAWLAEADAATASNRRDDGTEGNRG